MLGHRLCCPEHAHHHNPTARTWLSVQGLCALMRCTASFELLPLVFLHTLKPSTSLGRNVAWFTPLTTGPAATRRGLRQRLRCGAAALARACAG
jgi:hypothetical protein